MRQNHTRSHGGTGRNQSGDSSPSVAGVNVGAAGTSGRATPRPSERDGGGKRLAEAAIGGVDGRIGQVKSRVRFDRPGHLADAHAARLLEMSRGRVRRDEFALVFESAAFDDLATELAEQAVTSMVGGGETWLDTVNAPVEEEDGGPFLEAGGASEVGDGGDPERGAAPLQSSAAERAHVGEPLVTTDSPNSVPFEGVRRGRRP